MVADSSAESGRLTTHVLDTTGGRPAAGVRVELFRLSDGGREMLQDIVTNDDGVPPGLPSTGAVKSMFR